MSDSASSRSDHSAGDLTQSVGNEAARIEQEATQPASESVSSEADKVVEKLEHRFPLWSLVLVGTVGVVILAGVLFIWFAWLQSHQPAPCIHRDSCREWLSHVNGAEIYNAARTTAAILAIVGVGGAALVAYRRQDTVERTLEFNVRAHQVAIEAQATAAKQFTLDSDKYQLDRERHQLEEDRRKDDQERELRARFTTTAEQLGSPNSAIRHAGAYALASLADDWHSFGNDAERQVCVDLLCAQLRSPRQRNAEGAVSRSDLKVRETIIALIRSHRPLVSGSYPDWTSCSLNLTGADLSEVVLSEIDLASVCLDRANLTNAFLNGANLSDASIQLATLKQTRFAQANLTNASIVFCRTGNRDTDDLGLEQTFFSGACLHGAWFHGLDLFDADFSNSDLAGAKFFRVRADGARFADAIAVRTQFIQVGLSEADFSNADLSGADLLRATEIADAVFNNTRYDDATKWPDGVVPKGAVKDAAGGPSSATQAEVPNP